MFKHPKYYKELRRAGVQVNSSRPAHSRCNKSDQAISDSTATAKDSVRPDPGHKLQAREDSTANSTRGQVAEPQASSAKLTKHQAASVKPRGTSIKLQAASVKLQDS